MERFGLIGYPLTHSFSKRYFTAKFEEMQLSSTHVYELYEIQDIGELPGIIECTEGLRGLNVTIPHKRNVLPYLSEIDPAAARIGAVNVIKIASDKTLIGYNSDYYGFRKSLEEFLDGARPEKALVLGSGGAAQAIKVALDDLQIIYKTVSRREDASTVSYADAAELIADHHLVINCTPLGTYPDIHTAPDLPYEKLSSGHYLYDLVYNPEETLFMKKGREKGAKVLNGYKMLQYQAEKSWEIWKNSL